MNQTLAEDLIERYVAGQCTPEEAALVEAGFLEDFKRNYREVPGSEISAASDRITTMVFAHLVNKSRLGATELWKRYLAIAAAVAAIVFGIWFYNTRHLDGRRDLLNYAQDIAPGKNTAILSFNGKSMQLSEAKTGIKIDDDKFTYNDGTALSGLRPSLPEGESSMVTATTPRGGTYQFVLQDGTKVWLNADSKLEFFPAYKNKNQRIVKLEGEAYFEVSKNRQKPFIVQSKGQNVTVLGTHFNVSAYKGEEIETTLLEGSVKVSQNVPGMDDKRKDSEVVILKPSQQAVLDKTFKIRLHTLLDAERSIAWAGIKSKPVFMFNDEELPSLLRKISRWYNVDVIDNTTKKRDLTFSGMVQRDAPLSAVVKILEATQSVHFKIEGRELIVTDWR